MSDYIDIVGNCANCGVEYHIHKNKKPMTESQEDKLRAWLNKSPEELLEVIEYWEKRFTGSKENFFKYDELGVTKVHKPLSEDEKKHLIEAAKQVGPLHFVPSGLEAYKELCEVQREYIKLLRDGVNSHASYLAVHNIRSASDEQIADGIRLRNRISTLESQLKPNKFSEES